MKYPLNLTFKIMALAPQITVTDASGMQVFYVRQKFLKLTEEVTIYADSSQTHPLYMIKADQVIDFGARYYITDANGSALGSVEQDGVKTIWKAHYQIRIGPTPALTIRENNPWIKVADLTLSLAPYIGPLLSGYLFHPSYRVATDSEQRIVTQLKKRPSLFQRRFVIDKVSELQPAEETVVLLSLLMMVLLEHRRG